MNGRIYDPQLGRFLSADLVVDRPLSLQGYNRYSYVHNNPLTYQDPSGYFLETLWDIGSAAVGIFEVGANLYAGDFKDAGIAAVGAAIDIGAAALPFVPGGASIAIKATKEAGEIAGKQILKEGLEEGAEKIAKEVGEKVTRESSSLSKIDNAKVEIGSTGGIVDPKNSPGSQIKKNAQQGKDFQNEVTEKVKKTDVDVQGEITIKPNGGEKSTRLDIASKDAVTGEIKLTEAKSSSTAPLTKNQKSGFPQIEKNGGVVTGKGKPGFEGGTEIPPTKVNIVRPEDLEKMH